MRLVKCGVNEALQALTYEMVHLYQHHFGDPGRGRYYNKGYWGFSVLKGQNMAKSLILDTRLSIFSDLGKS